MPALLSWLLSAFGTLVGYQVMRFAAWKVFLWIFAITIFPALFMHIVYIFYAMLISTVSSVDSQYSAGNGYILNLTGLAAWFAIHLRLVDGFALIMSAVLFRITVRMIPFVRL